MQQLFSTITKEIDLLTTVATKANIGIGTLHTLTPLQSWCVGNCLLCSYIGAAVGEQPTLLCGFGV